MKISLSILFATAATVSAFTPSSFVGSRAGIKSPASTSSLCMKYKVAVVGGGPAGACAAEIFAQEKGIDTVLIERKLDNAKPCGGAIPLCMVGEFDLPETVVDRKVRFCQMCRQFVLWSCTRASVTHPESLSVVVFFSGWFDVVNDLRVATLLLLKKSRISWSKAKRYTAVTANPITGGVAISRPS